MLIGPVVDEMGYDLVRLVISGKHQPRLQIMAEAKDGSPMTADRCVKLSRAISAILDVEDPIAGPYTLEVGSPGIDRPLVRLADFERFAGFEARIEALVPIDGKRRFQGRLLGVDGETVRIRVEGEDIAIPYSNVRRAKLVLTDELLKSAASPKS